MHIRKRAAAWISASLLVTAATLCAQSTQAKTSVEEIRHELMQLPYYGVFDFLAFKYDRGSATLLGWAYRPGLKHDAERAVKRASGVDVVKNNIEELPPNQNDEEMRWKVYYAIYRDPFLSRYAPGGGFLWGHRHAYGGGFYPSADGTFAGSEPAGDYPIHIIVKNGRVALYGVVDNDGDRNLAEQKARQIPGEFGFENHLMVESARQTSQR